jgi:hypothetical protein
MIVCTTQNDTLLLALLLDCMTVPAVRLDAPDGTSIFKPDLADCLNLYHDLDLYMSAEQAPSDLGSVEVQTVGEGVGGLFTKADCSYPKRP